MVFGDVNLRIHHGGEFILKDYNRYYEGGKVDFIYNVSLDTLCLDGCTEMVEKKFGYKDCKLYWHNGGESLNSCNMVICALEYGNCIIYIDHASEVEDDKEGSESDGNDSDWIDSEDDDSDADYSGNESNKDEEFNEIVEKKKLISKSKKNPKVEETSEVF
ncbi:hypothetical protein POM88_004112 [Heracleum sosnowskyi]|uniref:PB1-like domain-containing protein n=1 Tax=Heracleum sosnowskyi TaxID=360622 RepID=A0AAD8ND00_9APIA|nr:hypothetical protein POM88_004112 [Heracleum sosnowskyi]